MPQPRYTKATIERFARTIAERDRKGHPRTYVEDDTVIAAIRGHALCFANATKQRVELTHDELTFGLTVYRRQRGMQKRPATGEIPLITVNGPNLAVVEQLR